MQSLAMGKYLLEPKVPVGLDLLPVLCDFLNRYDRKFIIFLYWYIKRKYVCMYAFLW